MNKLSNETYLYQVLSQQNNKSNEQKIDMITDEIRRLRQESNEKIEFLTQEVERLDKQIREQQEDIDYLHNENADVKERWVFYFIYFLKYMCWKGPSDL